MLDSTRRKMWTYMVYTNRNYLVISVIANEPSFDGKWRGAPERLRNATATTATTIKTSV